MKLEIDKKDIKYVHVVNRTIMIAFDESLVDVDCLKLTFRNYIELDNYLENMICTYDLVRTDRDSQYVVEVR